MRGTKFIDRCFVAVVLVVLIGFMAGVAMALLDCEPRLNRTGLLLTTLK